MQTPLAPADGIGNLQAAPLYTVLLVEDEMAIREGIRDTIEWASLGFRFSGEAKNGVEAVEIFDSLQPDLLITDIRMPMMDGLELIEHIRRQGNDTKILILTGFDEFSYARKALQLKVRDYLLKPVSPDEIAEALTKIKKELDSQNRLSKQVQMSDRLAKQLTMFKLISGLEHDEKILPESRRYCVVVYDYDEEYRSINPDDYIENFKSVNGSDISTDLVLDGGGMLVEILSSSRDFPPLTKLKEITENKRKTIEQKSERVLSAGVGSPETSITGIRYSYLSAKHNMSQRFSDGGASVYTQAVTPPQKDVSDDSVILRIENAIATGSFVELTSLFDSLIENLNKAKAAEQHCRNQMTLVISAMLHGINKKRSHPEASGLLDSSLLAKAGTFKTLAGLRRWFMDIVELVREEILEGRSDSSLLMAEKARIYIDSHFSDPTLSLETLCSHLGTSISTFSRIFKTYNNTTFSAYLTEVRINHAIKLMNRSDLRNKEIAHQIGFSSPHYFSHVFTKSKGFPPSFYRKALRLEAATRKEVR